MKNIFNYRNWFYWISHLVKHMVTKYPNYVIYNLDALTYAGNLENLKSIESFPNYKFLRLILGITMC